LNVDDRATEEPRKPYPNRFTSTKQPDNSPGRPAGIPNKITQSMKDALIAAAEELGAIPKKEWKKLAAQGDPEYPLRGYFKTMAVDNPRSFATLMGRALPLHIVLSQRQNYYTDEEAKAQLRSVGLPDGVLDFLRPVDLKKIDRRPSPYADPEADEDGDMVDVTPK
jgi:hypothetical protein